MREKELRIALVCFGGVSLAVYMHGVTKEILKLVRASAALHGIRDRATRATASFFDHADPNDREYDTEAVYFELLREIGHKVELRVIVDIIAGASAGGINGTMLARALSHDLPIDAQRNLWLRNADVTELLAPEARASAWSKFFLLPFIWAAMHYGMLPNDSPEVRSKLSLFLRSRWFKPPLSGDFMDDLMYDAVVSMGTPRASASSLIPSGQSLDLFVTLTDYHGYSQLVPIHDPPVIHDVDHHHVLRFKYQRWANGEVRSDFVMGNAPALAFAARATSSFPGAFPPARVADIDRLVRRRRAQWPLRENFIANNFDGHRMATVDPVVASFIDGSVLNNRPFREAIAAIHGRPAYRQVDRRLVYIDPDPTPLATVAKQAVPGFFSMLRGALSDIPLTQPVTDELSWVAQFNEQVARLKGIVENARPRINDLVDRAIGEPLDQPVTVEHLQRWRERVNAHAVTDAGFAYESYVRLKLASVRDFLASLIVKLRDVPERSPLARVISVVVHRWAQKRGLLYEASPPAPNANGKTGLPRWAEFLLVFDVEYRERRMNFLIEGQNRLYEMLDSTVYVDLNPQVVDRLKRSFYAMLDDLRDRQGVHNFGPESYNLACKIFAATPAAEDLRRIEDYADAMIERHGADIDRLVDRLAHEIDLDATTHDLDVLLADLKIEEWHHQARRDVLVSYLGFPFWDVLTFPLMSREAGEFNQILIDRISPQDARVLKGFAGTSSLKGTGFGHFAAFLSRAYRENDYLLGRLHALERLIDIVCDSAGIEPQDKLDIMALKKRGFLRIIAAEDRHLVQSRGLIRSLQKAIGEMR